jgi:hypothetical protein
VGEGGSRGGERWRPDRRGSKMVATQGKWLPHPQATMQLGAGKYKVRKGGLEPHGCLAHRILNRTSTCRLHRLSRSDNLIS